MLIHETSIVPQVAALLEGQLNESGKFHNAIVSAFFPGLEIKKQVNKMALDTAMGLMTKACKTYRAIELLAANGLGEDSKTLARSLYESLLMLLFIFKDSDGEEGRAAMIHVYTARQHMKMLEQWEDRPSLQHAELSSWIAKDKARLDHYEKYVPANVDARRHWSGEGNLENAAKSLEHDDSYQLIYRTLSSHPHGTDITSHIVVGDLDQPSTLNICPSTAHVESALTMSRSMLWMMAERINTRLEAGLDETILRTKPQDFLSVDESERRHD